MEIKRLFCSIRSLTVEITFKAYGSKSKRYYIHYVTYLNQIHQAPLYRFRTGYIII